MAHPREVDGLGTEFATFVNVAEIGRGTSGIVYLAMDATSHREVAIKIPILAGTSNVNERLVRFRREAQAMAYLQDDNVVTCHMVGEQDGHPFYVREYVAGSTLEQLFKNGSMDLVKAAEIIARLARIIKRVHERGIVHRNLRAANLLIARDGTLKLIGFGRVGFVTASARPEIGKGAESDVRSLQQMLFWACMTLHGSIPQALKECVAFDWGQFVGPFAESLEDYLRS